MAGQGDGGRKQERRQRKLDEALEDTFPASDPPAVRPNRADPDPAPDAGGNEAADAPAAGREGEGD